MNQDNGGIIGKINTPTTNVASGVWTLDSQFEAQSSSIWPLAFPQTTFTNSCRFDDGSSDYLTQTQGAGNRRTFTISCWLKRSTLGTHQMFFNAYPNASNDFQFAFLSGDTLEVIEETSGSATWRLTTNRLFRDVGAWYHIVLAVDTTQSTSSDRAKLYVNGVQETSFSTETYPSLNYDNEVNNSLELRLSSRGDNSKYFDGYMSEVVFIDGLQLDASYFGETNSTTNIWVPKPIGGQVGSFGTNGFYLDFADSSSLGNDVSGNDNDFTVNNLTSVDQSTDIPTNNFCTWNGNIKSDVTLAEGNLEMSGGALSYDGTVGTIIPNQGKWYAEIKVTVPTNLQIGFITDGTFIDGARSLYTAGSSIYWQDNVTTIRYYLKGVVQSGYATVTGGTNSVSTYTTNDVIMLAMDLDNGYAWFGKNGTWQNSGDPAGGTNAFNLASDYADGTTIFSGHNNSAVQANFGNPPYSITSGNSDGNGYGNFEYAVPSGYYALNSANLNTYG